MKLLFLLGLFLSLNSFAQIDFNEKPETQEEILRYLTVKFSNSELDPIEYFVYAKQLKRADLNQIENAVLSQIESDITGIKNNSPLFINDFKSNEAIQFVSQFDILSNREIVLSKNAQEQFHQAKRRINNLNKFNPLSVQQVKSLLYGTPDGAYYNNGEYKDTVRLFLFCREDRSYPCLFVMKDIFGNFVRNGNVLWSLPALAKSARNIPYYKTNGQTPTGVHSMDSVMPEANRQAAFGKFRRVILNWIPKNNGEKHTLNFLPKSHYKLDWWKRANVARDAGRLHLRIHGTGRVNDEPSLPYYPHVPTSGCISTKEGKYNGVVYKDQRKILDQIMRASQLKPVFSNEPNIKGILYVVNIDQKKKAVRLSDLKKYGVR